MEILSSYHIFYTVARCGNISKAAGELFISQPAVSKSIKKLEHTLNTTLFIRTSRGVALTDDGNLLFEHIRSAFASIQEGEHRLKQNHNLGTGRLHIGVSTTLCKHIMLPILQNFIQENPHITITIDCLSSTEAAHRLWENQLDVALLAETTTLGQLDFIPFTELSYSFVASQSYLDNLQLREHIRYQDGEHALFPAATLILMDEGNISRQHAEQYFQTHSIPTGQILETSNMELLVEFAKIGLGISCVIRNFVESDIQGKNLVEIPLRKNMPTRQVGFAFSKESGYNPAVEKFRQTSCIVP